MSRREHIKAPPEPTGCPNCGYPLYDGDQVCPGCGISREESGRTSNVRVVKIVKPLSPLIRLREASDAVVKSAVAYRNTLDPEMGRSMQWASQRLLVAVLDIHHEVIDLLMAQAESEET